MHVALPVLHKYDFAVQLKECEAVLEVLLPARLALHASTEGGGYVVDWLQLAGKLQMDGIQARYTAKYFSP